MAVHLAKYDGMMGRLVLWVVMLAACSAQAAGDPGLGLAECPANQPATFKCYNRGFQLPEELRVGRRIPGCVVDPIPGTPDPISRCIDKGTKVWPPTQPIHIAAIASIRAYTSPAKVTSNFRTNDRRMFCNYGLFNASSPSRLAHV